MRIARFAVLFYSMVIFSALCIALVNARGQLKLMIRMNLATDHPSKGQVYWNISRSRSTPSRGSWFLVYPGTGTYEADLPSDLTQLRIDPLSDRGHCTPLDRADGADLKRQVAILAGENLNGSRRFCARSAPTGSSFGIRTGS